MKSLPSIWHLLHDVKSKVKILSIFVAFLENMNFNLEMSFGVFNFFQKMNENTSHTSKNYGLK